MKNLSPSSQTLVGALVLIYWMPLAILSVYSTPGKSWTLALAGLALSAFGAMAFWLLMRQWEQSIHHDYKAQLQTLKDASKPLEPIPPPPPPQPIVDEEKLRALETVIAAKEKTIEEKQQHIAKAQKETERCQLHVDSLKQELGTVKNYFNDQLEDYKNLLAEHQKTIADLREALQSKQQVTMQLESKVRDLSYEIKTILQIAEGPQEHPKEPPPPLPKEKPPHPPEKESGQIHTFEEALMLLKRCVDSAQRMPGASHFTKSQRFKDLPFDNYALDLRRLFDHFQNEADGALFVYSPKEDRILFVTDQIDKLLGINAEKFLKSFQEVIQEGKEDWNRSINQLSFKNESKVILPMKTRTGQEIPVTCVLGMIPTGNFRHNILGVLFSDIKPTYKPFPAAF